MLQWTNKYAKLSNKVYAPFMVTTNFPEYFFLSSSVSDIKQFVSHR